MFKSVSKVIFRNTMSRLVVRDSQNRLCSIVFSYSVKKMGPVRIRFREKCETNSCLTKNRF